MKSILTAAVLAAFFGSALADGSSGTIEVHAWSPPSQLLSGSATQSDPYGSLSLAPLVATSTGHPFDPPNTSGAAASLSFDRPGTGDATYHSFAAGYAFAYTPVPYAKSGRTQLGLTGSMRILPDDLSRLLGLLPPEATILLQSQFFLEGKLVAEASQGSAADAGASFTRILDGQTVGGSVSLHGADGADPAITTGGLLAGNADAHLFNSLELALMFPGTTSSFGIGQARGATLFSQDTLTEFVHFVGECTTFLCLGGISYYDAPISFSIETWGDVGTGQASIAAADFANTMSLSFTVLDANGQATDIPVYLTLSAVPEPAAAWLWLAAAFPLWLARRRR